MNDRLDLETMAAFIEGTLDEAERRRVLVALGESPADYEVFADAVLLRSGLDAESGGAAPPDPAAVDPKVRPIPTRLAARPWVPLVAAAGLAAVVGTYTWVGGDPGPSETAGLVGSLVPGWEDQTWSVVRGSDEGRFTAQQLAFRIGVRSVDLDVALEADDREVARRMATELEGLASQVEFGQALARLYRDVGDALDDPAGDVRGAARAANAQVRTDLGAMVELGRWVERSRLSARAGRVAYFTGSDAAPPALTDPDGLPDEAVVTLAAVDSAVSAGVDEGDLPVLLGHFETLIRTLGP